MVSYEPIVLKKLLGNSSFYEIVVPHIENDYFNDIGNQEVFKLIANHYNQYETLPVLTELVASVKNVSNTHRREIIEKSLEIVGKTEEVANIDFMLKETEQWIKDSLLMKSLQIGSDGLMKKNASMIEQSFELSALSKTFSLNTQGKNTKTLYEIEQMEFEDYKWHCESFIPIIENNLIMVTGRGASGKGISMLRTALLFLEENKEKMALLWNMEDSINDIKMRVKALRNNGVEISSDVLSRLSVLDTTNDVKLQQMEQEFQGYDLVVVDPISHLIDGEENDAGKVKPLMKFFQNMCKKFNKTIILVHHEAKGNDGKGSRQARGSSAFFDNSRLSYSLKYEDGEYFVDTVKNNYGENRDSFQIHPWSNHSTHKQNTDTFKLSEDFEEFLDGIA